jgi:hypothetical protein
LGFLADAIEALNGGGDMLEELGFSKIAAEVSVGPQSLHETLGGAEEEGFSKLGEGEMPVVGIILQQLFALRAGERDVGIVKQGGEIVFGKTQAEALVIDEPSFVFVQQDVLTLEVAVDKAAWQAGETATELGEALFHGGAAFIWEIPVEVSADKVVEEIVLLPEVKAVVKGGLEFGTVLSGEAHFRDGVNFRDFLEGGLVAGAEDFPGFVSVGVEIISTEILKPNAEAVGIVQKNGGDMNTESGEAAGGGREFGIVPAGMGIDHEDHGQLVRAWPREAVVMPV